MSDLYLPVFLSYSENLGIKITQILDTLTSKNQTIEWNIYRNAEQVLKSYIFYIICSSNLSRTADKLRFWKLYSIRNAWQ